MHEFYKNVPVTVTGGTGFVGSHFAKALAEAGADVTVVRHKRDMPFDIEGVKFVEADLCDREQACKALEGARYVFHAAGAVSAAGTTTTNPTSAITENLVLTARTLEAASTAKVERCLIFSSGTTAYPLTDHPVTEDEMWGAPPPDVYFGYGWMRRYLELLGQFTAQKGGVDIAICRPTAVYGRYDDFNLKTCHVVPALINRAVAGDSPLEVWGTGDEMRDFLHITDLVRGCMLLLMKKADCTPINIGYGSVVTIRDIAEIVMRAAGRSEADIKFDPDKPTTIAKRLVNTDKARELLGFEPAVTLEEGLTDVVRWFKGVRGQ
ncbi:NAD(P)-dependent oxidoreductase [uncultured Pseudodesulfovibrio sp.]|uniref:NAD-dependent epimerase/dehydratase family protein n=1 Tax=uncultured Pseudodesulfovibrio sp. TaxID=2035858 RepID=UPI0029C954BD|nr:NAD(P)-dependent oxidoreductase [uncultured Pseudodesulfovibrio sp.]